MKVWQISAFGFGGLEMKEVPKPKPRPGEVLVKVQAVSLNYRDLMMMKGFYNPNLPLPRIPCSDGAGEVVEVGAEVRSVRPGDRVAGIFMQNWLEGRLTAERGRAALGGDVDGMLAEYVKLPEQGVIEIPRRLSYVEASTLPCAGVTAWNAVVHAGGIRPGEVVVIQGTGGVSIFALQFAKMLGAKVLGTSSSNDKLARAKGLGLDAGLNYKTTPDWSSWVREQTGGEGADLIVEVGGGGTLNQSLAAVRIAGVVAQIGVLSQSAEPIQIPLILRRQIQLKGIYVGSRQHFSEMIRALEENQLRPQVDATFSFGDAPAALRALDSGSHFGKLVIEVGG